MGAGHAIKLAKNACSAAALAMAIEAVAVATRAGLDPRARCRSRFGAAAASLYREALERGLAELDHTAIAKLIEERTGTRLRAGSGGA